MLSAEIVQAALDQIQKRPASHDYFFSQITSPDWLEPLAEAGLFAVPPAPTRSGSYISFPFWPESQYLARMAPLAPERVAALLEKMPATENIRVHDDLAKAAGGLPVNLALKWVKREIAWIEQQKHLYFLPDSFAALFHRLSDCGDNRLALSLAKAILTLRSVDEADAGVVALVDTWSYKGFLQNHFIPNLPRFGTEGLALLCGRLDAVLADPSDSARDFSYFWRPAVEAHEQNVDHNDLRDALIDAVRDGAQRLLDAEQDARSIAQVLLKREHSIFRRIALNLLIQTPDHPLAQEMVLEHGYFFDPKVWHEYGRLMAAVFPRLGDQGKTTILDWIEEADPRQTDRNDREITKERKRNWQIRRLFMIRDHLPERWAKYYEELIAEFGELERPEFLSYSTSWWGPTSPKTSEDMDLMSVEEIAGYLKSWQPSEHWHAPEPEGLGRVLQATVAKTPNKFAGSIDSFFGVDSTYARSLVQGFEESVKAGHEISWENVIRYLTWITDQPRDFIRPDTKRMDRDLHWGWARRAAVSLLSVGFEKQSFGLALRWPVWHVIAAMTEDPDPTPGDDGTSTLDAATQAINTTRGEAMHAVVRYALWVRREYVDDSGTSSGGVSFTMNDIPEARGVLERHLDPKIDPSPAVRSVYGQWFPWLHLLDREWATSAIRAIFPDENEYLRDAAWNTYLTYSRVYEEPFCVLRPLYSAFVDRLAQRESRTEDAQRPVERLGDHLLAMVSRGVVVWEDDDQLVRRFFDKASIAEASRVLSTVGQSLRNYSGEIPREVVARFVAFWEALAQRVYAARDRAQLLKPFGWWFACGCFENAWAFKQLRLVLQTVGTIDPDFMVAERLAELADQYPTESLEILRILTRTDQQGWGLLAAHDSMRVVLAKALRDRSTAAEAEATIHELGSRGYFQFRDLLGL